MILKLFSPKGIHKVVPLHGLPGFIQDKRSYSLNVDISAVKNIRRESLISWLPYMFRRSLTKKFFVVAQGVFIDPFELGTFLFPTHAWLMFK
jgi:hypothetical protein